GGFPSTTREIREDFPQQLERFPHIVGGNLIYYHAPARWYSCQGCQSWIDVMKIIYRQEAS
ncbi:unnamed protein product, partial [Musa textilis]